MADAREAYLESQVMTATPQKLRLMLIDAALRRLQAVTTELDRESPDDSVISESLTKTRAVISELLSSIRDDGGEVAKRLIGVYLYLFQSLTDAQLSGRTDSIQEVVSILQVERETWRQVCEKYPDAPPPEERQQAMGREIKAEGPAIISTFAPPNSVGFGAPSGPPSSSGFSADA